MIIERRRSLAARDGHGFPAILIMPERPSAGLVLLHPYGGGKEQMLGLALAAAERGFASLAIDSCGHGENQAPLSATALLDETEAAITWLRRWERVACAGVSLGGRLALMSSADMMVAISPAVVSEVSPLGQWMFETFPSPAVREPYPGYVIELLKELGPIKQHDHPCLLLYAKRDIQTIMAGAQGLQSVLPCSEVRYVTRDLRPDVEDLNAFIRYLPRWFNHGELKFNVEALETTSAWLAAHLASAHAA